MRPWNLLGRGRPGYLTIGVFIATILAVITLLEIVVWPNHNLALFYALPVILASGYESPWITVLVTALSALLIVFDAAVGHTWVNVWALLLLAVLLYGYFMSGRWRARC